MRKFLICVIVLYFFFLISVSLGWANGLNASHNDNLYLYKRPSKKSSLTYRLRPSEKVIPFYQVDDWIKVGSTKDGKVGWMEKQSYIQNKHALYPLLIEGATCLEQRPISTEIKKPFSLITYKNGKQINEREAVKLYGELQRPRILEQLYQLGLLQNMMHMGYLPPTSILQPLPYALCASHPSYTLVYLTSARKQKDGTGANKQHQKESK